MLGFGCGQSVAQYPRHIAEEADGGAGLIELGYRAKNGCHPLASLAFVEQV
jgi:hypothetical protein